MAGVRSDLVETGVRPRPVGTDRPPLKRQVKPTEQNRTMTHKKAIQSLNEEEAELFQMVIEGSDAVGSKKIWERDIHPSRHAMTTQEAIDKLIDLALVTKERGGEECHYRLHITVKAAEAVGLYWNRHDEWAMRPEVEVSGVFWRDIGAVMYRLRNGDLK